MVRNTDSQVRSECSGCGEVFKTTAGHTKHRIGGYGPGERRCMTEKEMFAAGMSKNDKGLWITETISPQKIQDRIEGHKRMSGELKL